MKKNLSRTVLRSIFHRKGGIGSYTLPFEQFEESVQHQLILCSPLLEGEEPVIACFRDISEWVLITTKRLIWSTLGELTSIYNTEIVDVTTDLLGDARTGARTKKDLCHLIIKTSMGERHTIILEPGPPFFAIWNVIKYIAALHSLEL
jgi:hypothetical protein